MMMLHTYLLAYMPMYYVPSLPALLLFILDNVKGLSILSALLCSFVPLSSYLKDDVIVIMSKIRDEVKGFSSVYTTQRWYFSKEICHAMQGPDLKSRYLLSLLLWFYWRKSFSLGVTFPFANFFCTYFLLVYRHIYFLICM